MVEIHSCWMFTKIRLCVTTRSKLRLIFFSVTNKDIEILLAKINMTLPATQAYSQLERLEIMLRTSNIGYDASEHLS